MISSFVHRNIETQAIVCFRDDVWINRFKILGIDLKVAFNFLFTDPG
jgi:hypothetical protein